MTESRAHLLSRKRDLFSAIRMLEQDHADGSVDDEAYHRARHRYESEAAEILERIDSLPADSGPMAGGQASLPLRWRSSKLLMALAAAALIAALSLGLATAIHSRAGAGGAPASAVPTPAPRSSALVMRTFAAVKANPAGLAGYIALGNAYVQNGQLAAADQTYLAALKLEPSNPDPLTLHAMMLGMANQYRQGIAVLHDVERAHPTFARAWLLDGLFSTHLPHGGARAVTAWKHFLALQPRGSVARQVRGWIAGVQRSEAGRRT